MAEIMLSAESREEVGKGVARKLRSKGLIPGVLYGRRMQVTGLSVNPVELYKAVSTEAGLNALIRLKVKGQKENEWTVLVKDLQVDPIRRVYLHADFLQVNPEDEVKVAVPINLVGKAAGVKEGGILQQVRRELEVLSRADSIPREIQADVSTLEIGDSLHLKDVKLPPGVRSALKFDVTLAACVPPAEEEKEATPIAAAVEGAAGAVVAGAPGQAVAPGAAPADGAAKPASEKPEKEEKKDKKEKK